MAKAAGFGGAGAGGAEPEAQGRERLESADEAVSLGGAEQRGATRVHERAELRGEQRIYLGRQLAPVEEEVEPRSEPRAVCRARLACDADADGGGARKGLGVLRE